MLCRLHKGTVHLCHVQNPAQETGLVDRRQNTVGRTLWSLTELGRKHVKTCFKLSNFQRLLRVDEGMDPLEMSKFQLMQALTDQGWTMKVVQHQKEAKEVRSHPFQADEDSDRFWYVKKYDSLDDIKPEYLQALLLASKHKQSVPHLGTVNQYRVILDPDYIPPVPKRKQVWLSEGDLEMLTLPDKKPRVRHARKPRLPAGPKGHDAICDAPDEADDAALPDHECVDELMQLLDEADEDAGEEDGNLSLCAEEMEAAVDDAAVVPDAGASPSSSGSSSSSSSSSSTSDSSASEEGQVGQASAKSKSAKAKAKTAPKAEATSSASVPACIQPHRKVFGRSIPFGTCFLTPRYKHKQLSGYQMTCTQPSHNVGKKCTKETSFGVAGSEKLCRQMLKSWLVFGASVPTREKHMGDVWKNILVMRDETGLPDEATLDAACVDSWDDYNSVKEASASSKPKAASVPPNRGATSSSSLGAAGKGVPPQVHAHMQDLANRGALPITTTQQRERQRFTSGSEYGVPHFYADARRWGYIGPNLPAPEGYIWRCGGHCQWVLCVRGG